MGVLEADDARGAFCDHKVAWIAGFVENLGKTSCVSAEIWALYYGLKFVTEPKFTKLKVELDSDIVVSWVKDGVDDFHPSFGLVNTCREIVRQQPLFSFQNVFRECNFVADYIAKSSYILVSIMFSCY